MPSQSFLANWLTMSFMREVSDSTDTWLVPPTSLATWWCDFISFSWEKLPSSWLRTQGGLAQFGDLLICLGNVLSDCLCEENAKCLEQWFLTCGEWGSCQVGNDRSDSRTTASKFNTSHPNVDLLYKSQPFTHCFNNKNNQYMRYGKSFTY